MQTNGNGKQQEQPEDQSSQLFAKQFATNLLGHHSVPGNVSRQQPEVNNGMTGEPEEGTGQLWINAINQAQGPGDYEPEHFGRNTDGGNLPHGHGNGGGQSNERCFYTRVLFAPGAQGEEHSPTANPGANYDQRQANVVIWRRLKRRVKGKEHSSQI